MYLNLIGDDPRKEKYKNEVYDILTETYKPFGGLLSSGTASPDEIKTIPLWKLVFKDNQLVAVCLYKDKNGRKVTINGTNGSVDGKRAIAEMLSQDILRSYGELGKGSIIFLLRAEPKSKQYFIELDKVEQLLGKEVLRVKNLDQSEWPIDGLELKTALATLERHPFTVDYGYFRKISGVWTFKIMAGTPHLPIK